MNMKLILFCVLSLALCQPGLAAATGAPADTLGADLVNPGHHDKPPWFKESFLDIREDVAEAGESDKRVILYFYQDGCPYCSKLLKDNFGNPDIAVKTQNAFDVIAINMWGDREVTDFKGISTTEKNFAESLRVQYTPTLLFLDDAGEVILRINGYFAPHKFRIALDYVAARQEKVLGFRDYYARAVQRRLAGKLVEIAGVLPHPLRLADNLKTAYRPLLVLFEQAACKPCDELHNDALKRPSVAAAMTNLDIAQVNMWSEEKVQTPDGRELEIRQWARELGVQYAPSLIFFDRKGQEVFRTEAYLKSFHLHGAMDYVVSGAYRAQPNFQRFLQHRTDALHARGIAVDLMD